VDSWIFALASVLLLACTNLFSVAKYGEFEFWFAIPRSRRSSASSAWASPR
jgi:L-asparagine transporter-like permease